MTWSTNDSAKIYQINSWGGGYFEIGPQGNLLVHPERDGRSLDLYKLVKDLENRGIDAPVLFRFNGILRNRVRRLQRAFFSAIDEYGYRATYHLAYPIKVNQQFHVVDLLRQAGGEHPLALEVGSKPELVGVLPIHDTPGGLLLCNGYKDREYIELAALAAKLGRRPIVIIEEFYELDLVLDVCQRLGAKIELGVRMCPAAQATTRWEE